VLLALRWLSVGLWVPITVLLRGTVDCSLAEVGFAVRRRALVLGMGLLTGPVGVVTGCLAAYVVPGAAHR
jgi:hypothetical protein